MLQAFGALLGVALVVAVGYLIHRWRLARRGWIETVDDEGTVTRLPSPPQAVRRERGSPPNVFFTTAKMDELQAYVHRTLPAAGWQVGDITSEPAGVAVLFRRGDQRLRIVLGTDLDLFKGRPLRSKLTVTVATHVKPTPIEVKVDEIQELQKGGGGGAVPRLTAFLGDADPRVRREAVAALATIEDERSLQPLLERLADEDVWVRQRAALALGELCRREGVDALLAGLSGGDPDVEAACAWSLGRLKDGRAVPALLVALERPYWRLRMQAAMALGEIGDPRAVDLLIRCLKDKDNAPKVRAVALASLTKLVSEERISAILRQIPAEPRLFTVADGVKVAIAEAVAEEVAGATVDLFGLE